MTEKHKQISDTLQSAEQISELVNQDYEETRNTPKFITVILPWIDISAKVGTLIILALALLQFWSADGDRKRERSLELVKEWVDSKHPQKISNLNSFIVTQVGNNKTQIEALPEHMREKAWTNADNTMFSRLAKPTDKTTHTLRGNLDELFSFFARANICIISDLCDQAVLEAYFKSEVSSLYKEFSPLVESIRANGNLSYAKVGQNLFLD